MRDSRRIIIALYLKYEVVAEKHIADDGEVIYDY